MVNETSPVEASQSDASTSDDAGESKLRGSGKARNPDTELHLDGEPDTLYSDGIDIQAESDTPAGTDGSSATIT
jgi:hypothetical protein